MGKGKAGRDKDARRTASLEGWVDAPGLRALVGSVPGTVLVLDATGMPRLASDRFRRLAEGASPDGGAWLEVLAPEDRPRAAALWLEAAEARSPREAALGLAAGGRATCRVTPVEAEGRVLGWIVALSEDGAEEERATLARAFALSEERRVAAEARALAAEARLAVAEAALRETDSRLRAATLRAESAEAGRHMAESRAGAAEGELRVAGARLEELERRLDGATAMLAGARERSREAARRQEDLEARLRAAEASLSAARNASQALDPRPARVPNEEPRGDLDVGPTPPGGSGAAEPAVAGGAVAPDAPGEGLPQLPPAEPPATPGAEADGAAEIDRLAARLRSEALRALLGRWRALGGDGIAPHPQGWATDLPGGGVAAMLAEVGQAQEPLRLRAIGPARPASAPLAQVLARSRSPDAAWRRCAESARPVHEFARAGLGGDSVQTHERLLLPFSSDGLRVDHVLDLSVAEASALPEGGPAARAS